MLIQFSKPRQPVARPFLFTSPKCRVAIPVHDVLVRYALEQASLDSSVREILYRNGPQIECPPISLAGVVLRREGGAFLLRVHETRPERSTEDDARFNFVLERHGLRLLERDAQDIHREPLFSNARAIWSHAGWRVPLMDRLKISVALEEGPQPIVELEDRARPTCDVVAAVCALACENLVRLNLDDAPLGPQTVVLGP
jgi:hypothetical protein